MCVKTNGPLTVQQQSASHLERLTCAAVTLEAAVAANQGCLKVKLIHLGSNLVTTVFMFPLTAEARSASDTS